MQQDALGPIDALGRRLSSETSCVVRMSATGSIFICSHGVKFSMTRLNSSNDWAWAREKHEREVKHGHSKTTGDN